MFHDEKTSMKTLEINIFSFGNNSSKYSLQIIIHHIEYI